LIRAVIVASSALIRAGLESLVEVAGAASTVPEAAALAADLAAELIVVDTHHDELPELSDSAVPVLLLTAEAQPRWLNEALRSGVRGVVPRDLPPEELAAAIEAAAAGLVVLHPQAMEGAVVSLAATASSPELLTPREIDVLRLLSDGASNKTIAWKLNISEHTAKFHVNSILSKMGAGSRTEAVMLGVRRGWIPL
jgi:two-component system, NarL family, response regulator YdfI